METNKTIYKIEEKIHEKYNKTIYVVNFTDQSERLVSMQGKIAVARKNDGYYSTFGEGGYIFKTTAKAQAFADAVVELIEEAKTIDRSGYYARLMSEDYSVEIPDGARKKTEGESWDYYLTYRMELTILNILKGKVYLPDEEDVYEEIEKSEATLKRLTDNGAAPEKIERAKAQIHSLHYLLDYVVEQYGKGGIIVRMPEAKYREISANRQKYMYN